MTILSLRRPDDWHLHLRDGAHMAAVLPFTAARFARALVMPSFYEGFGLPALEAMACGTPVIVSNVSSLPEVVGDAGILVPPKDSESIAVAMWRILSDPRLREEMRAKGLSRAACFSWAKAARQTLDVFHEVMSQT